MGAAGTSVGGVTADPREAAAALDARDAGDLRGLTVLVTRPADQAEATGALIEAAGGRALLSPCLRAEPPGDPQPLRAALAELARFTWIAVTSQCGAQALALALRGAGPLGPQVAAVGSRTAAALREAGIAVALEAPAHDRTGAGLAEALLRAAPGPVLLPRAEEGREELAEALAARGVAVTSVAAYRMAAASAAALAPACQALRQGQVDLLPFASPRTAAVLLAALSGDAAAVLARTLVGAIGPTTAQALREAGVAVAVTAQGSFPELLRGLARVYRERKKGDDGADRSW